MAGLVMAPLVLVASANVGASTVHAPTRVPDVLHESRAQVFAAMTSAGLFFRTDGPGSADGTWRSATAENPRAGTLVAWHATVIIATSLEAPAVSVHALTRVPHVLHESPARVYAAMASAGLYFVTRGPGSANRTWTTAVAQTPRAGTMVPWHATVTLTTARARARVAATHPPARVPRVVGLSRPRALAALSKRGILVRTQGPGSADGEWTVVAAQNRRPGTLVPWHSTVLLTTRRGSVRPTSAVTPPTTTTTRPASSAPVRTTTSVPSGHSRVGLATWYAYYPGRCATSYLPKGTVITVRDVATGRSVRCEVTDRQAKSPGRVVDLSQTQFRQLAPLWRGVIFVKVTW